MTNLRNSSDASSTAKIDLAKVRRERQQRYHAASRAVTKLERENRVPLRDRPVLAGNLGRMIEKMIPGGKQGNVAKVFKDAFGKEWESFYRKRKRYIRFTGEPSPAPHAVKTGDFNALGANYTALADAIAKHAGPIPDVDPQELPALSKTRLIARTSFDEASLDASRSQNEHQEELMTVLDRIVERIEREVDLDRFRLQANSVCLGMSNRWPEQGDAIRILSGSDGWGRTLDLPLSTEGPNLAYSRLAPRTQVCELWSPLPISSAAVIEVPAHRIERMGERRAVQWTMLRLLDAATDGEEERFTACEEALENAIDDRGSEKGFADPVFSIADQVPGAKVDPKTLDACMMARLHLFLELRYHSTEGRWVPAFDLRPWVYGWSHPAVDLRIRKNSFGHRPNQLECFFKPVAFRRMGGTAVGTHYLLAESNFYDIEEDFISAYADDPEDALEHCHAPINGHFAGMTRLPEPAAFRLLLDPIDETRHQPFGFSVPSGLTGAPPGSIAHSILANFAYEDDDERRIDSRLLADARLRAEKLDQFLQEQEHAYREALARRR